jgi:hypothetical protein
MRKIVSKEETKRKEKIKNRIIGISLLAIMVLSVFGIVVDSIGKNEDESGKITYHGVDFFNQQERWIFIKDNVEYYIVNSPENLTEISIENVSSIESYYGKPLYLNSFDKSLESEISYNFNKIAYRMQYGCLNDTECDGDYPIKTCEDKMIIIEKSNETSVTQEENCVFIKAPEQEIQRVLDAFFLKVTGIN